MYERRSIISHNSAVNTEQINPNFEKKKIAHSGIFQYIDSDSHFENINEMTSLKMLCYSGTNPIT